MKEGPDSDNMGTKKSSKGIQVGRVLRKYFVTGLATLFPVFVTLYLLVIIFKFADSLLGKQLHANIPGLGLLLTVIIILGVGVLSSHFFGRVFFLAIEAWFSRFPLVKKIYPAVKQLTKFIFNEENSKKHFRRVVLVQYPRPGIYSIAFVTNEHPPGVFGPSSRLLTLLIPIPPSPVTGPIVLVPEDEVISLEMSVEEAITVLVSGGIAFPASKSSLSDKESR